MALPPKLYQFLIGVFASVGSILYGYDLGVIAGAIGSTNFINYFGDPSTNETGAVVSVYTGGAFCGAAIAGPLGDRFGRRLTIMIGAVTFLLGGGLQTGAQNLNFLYAGRAIAGLGVGQLVMIIPVYQAEIAHKDVRGRITALQQFLLGIGSLVATWTAWACYAYPDSSTKQWRIPLSIQLIPAGVLALLILLFPESPRWLMAHGQSDRALYTLAKLHAHGNVDDAYVRAEFDQIQETIAFEAEHEAKSYMELFKDRSSFRRLFLTASIQASVQMTGVSVIQYYSVELFEQIGISSRNTLKYQGIASVIAILGQISCVLFIDWTGRRWAMIWGNIGNGIAFLINTILLAKYPPGTVDNDKAAWAFIVMTWVYQYTFSATCGPLSFVIPVEIFNTRTRAKGVSIGTMVSFAFNTMVGQTTDLAISTIGGSNWFIVFTVCNFTNALFFWAVLPETAKRPLEEMDYLFANAPWFVPGIKMDDYQTHDLERRVEEIGQKGEVQHVE